MILTCILIVLDHPTKSEEFTAQFMRSRLAHIKGHLLITLIIVHHTYMHVTHNTNTTIYYTNIAML